MRPRYLVALALCGALTLLWSDVSFAQQRVERMLQRAQQGYIKDQLSLGMMYRDGRGFPRNSSLAMYWIDRAAESGSPAAQLELGTLFLVGNVGIPDPIRALKWLRRSAATGYLPAIYNIGVFCLDGQIPRCGDGMEMISRAAEKGYAPAETVFGNALIDGHYGLVRNPSTGRKWLRRSAKHEFPLAQYSLGLVYLTGDGVRPDTAAGLRWLQKAAGQGFAPAEDVLGRMYLRGKDIAVDLQKAESLLSSATQHGSNISFVPLAYLHFTQQRLDEAYFDVLCSQQSEVAENESLVRTIRAALEPKLSLEERSKLQIHADSWIRAHSDVFDPICRGGTCVNPLRPRYQAYP